MTVNACYASHVPLPGHSQVLLVLPSITSTCSCARSHALKASTSQIIQIFFLEDRISEEAASAVTGDEPSTIAHAGVAGSGDAEFSNIDVENSLYDSSDRVSQLKALIELEIHNCISASAN